MDVILFSIRWQFVFVYVDDIVIFSKTQEMHIELVRKFLLLLNIKSAALKQKKYIFFTNTVDFAEHLVRPRCLKLVFDTTDAIRRPKPQTNVTELSFFFGL